MSIIFTGINGLKKVNSIFRTKAKFVRGFDGISSETSVMKDLNPVRSIKFVKIDDIILKGNQCLATDKNKRIQGLIQKQLLCQEAIRIKQEINNFNSIIFFKFSLSRRQELKQE